MSIEALLQIAIGNEHQSTMFFKKCQLPVLPAKDMRLVDFAEQALVVDYIVISEDGDIFITMQPLDYPLHVRESYIKQIESRFYDHGWTDKP